MGMYVCMCVSAQLICKVYENENSESCMISVG